MNDANTAFLTASVEFARALENAGRCESFPSGRALFSLDDENEGVFLIKTGRVCMSVRDRPKLDRVFGPDSLLGVPATFTGQPYSLTAMAVIDTEAVHVLRSDFLQLMQDLPALCREATDMLCKETAFIERAIAERRRGFVSSER